MAGNEPGSGLRLAGGGEEAAAPAPEATAAPAPGKVTIPRPRYGQLVFISEMAMLYPQGDKFIPIRGKAPAGTVMVAMLVAEQHLDGHDPLDLDAQMDKLGWVRKAPKPQLVMPNGEAVASVQGSRQG